MFIKQFTHKMLQGRYNYYAHFIDEETGTKDFISSVSHRQKVAELMQSSLSPDPELLNLFYCPFNFTPKFEHPKVIPSDTIYIETSNLLLCIHSYRHTHAYENMHTLVCTHKHMCMHTHTHAHTYQPMKTGPTARAGKPEVSRTWP